jgi:glyoxylase-like metal-dependent hydrolase (beta-lactamase superfamily II)
VTSITTNSMRVGQVEIVSVIDSIFNCPLNIGFPTVTAERWQQVDSASGQRGIAPLTVGSFLVRTPRRTLLVDTGIGPAGAPGFGIPPGRLLDALKEADTAPEDIDAVVITHLHVDHVGWNAREQDGKIVPTFPKAKYYIARAEYDFFTAPAMLEQSPFLKTQAVALVEAGGVELFDSEATLAEELTLIPTPGHTPAHASIAITSGGEQGFILGDVAHHPGQVAHPEMRTGFDVDGDQAQQTREAMWQRIQELGAKVAARHFPPPGFGRIVLTEGRRMWQGL